MWMNPDVLVELESDLTSRNQGGKCTKSRKIWAPFDRLKTHGRYPANRGSRLGTMINFSDPSLLFLTPPVLIFLVCILDSHSRFFFRGEGYWSFGICNLKLRRNEFQVKPAFTVGPPLSTSWSSDQRAATGNYSPLWAQGKLGIEGNSCKDAGDQRS